MDNGFDPTDFDDRLERLRRNEAQRQELECRLSRDHEATMAGLRAIAEVQAQTTERLKKLLERIDLP